MTAHLTAVAFSLAVYLLLGLAYFGWGRWVLTLVRVYRQTPDAPFISVWLGWSTTLFIFQVLHFVLPIGALVVVPVLFLGVALSAPRVMDALRALPTQRNSLIVAIVIVLTGLVVAAWVASRAMLPTRIYDAGLYHFQAIRWINTYPLVPGLANLQSRLGFNVSFFTYVAALNFHPLLGHGRSLANSSLLLFLAATLLPSLRSVLLQPSLLTRRHAFVLAPALLMLPMVAYLARYSVGLGSPDADLTSTILQMVMFVMFTRGVGEWLEGQENQDQRALVLAVLAATAVSVKLSNLGFSAVIIAITLYYAWRVGHRRIRGIVRLAVPVAVIVLVVGLRGSVMSGAPFYPSTIGYLPVDWAVPKAEVVKAANLVHSWARQPWTRPSEVLGHWGWIGLWSRRILAKNRLDVVYPLALAVLFGVATMAAGILSSLRKPWRPRLAELSILLPAALGLAYWFFTAPDPRFVGAHFWLLSLGSALLLLSFLRAVLKGRALLAAMTPVLVAAVFPTTTYLMVRRGFREISFSGWHPIIEAPLIKKKTLSGLEIYTVPEPQDQCWDSPLPSTPDFNPHLRLRNPGDIASGFTVAKWPAAVRNGP